MASSPAPRTLIFMSFPPNALRSEGGVCYEAPLTTCPATPCDRTPSAPPGPTPPALAQGTADGVAVDAVGVQGDELLGGGVPITGLDDAAEPLGGDAVRVDLDGAEGVREPEAPPGRTRARCARMLNSTRSEDDRSRHPRFPPREPAVTPWSRNSMSCPPPPGRGPPLRLPPRGADPRSRARTRLAGSASGRSSRAFISRT